MSNRPELEYRAQQYCGRKGLLLGNALGAGVHGNVYSVESQTEKQISAIKVHEQQLYYLRERDVYLRLKEAEVMDIRGCAVPEMLDYDDELWIIEMAIVTRPFVLDFAGAYLDDPPDFSEEVMADWRAEKQEQFGSRWPEVQAILRFLEGHGIYMEDVNPNNISFGE